MEPAVRDERGRRRRVIEVNVEHELVIGFRKTLLKLGPDLAVGRTDVVCHRVSEDVVDVEHLG